MQHRIIEDRVYRVRSIEAADTHEASLHISAEPPYPAHVRRQGLTQVVGGFGYGHRINGEAV